MALYPFTVDGNTYNEVDFDGFGYTTALPNSMADILRQALLLHSATSSSSVSIGTGAKSLTVNTGRAFRVGDDVFIADASAPQTNRMHGQVTSYSFATGALNVNVRASFGSGTLTSWYVGLGGVSAAFTATEYMLALDQGGTGYGRTGFTQPCGFLGLAEPSVAMRELMEDFAGSQGNTSTLSSDNRMQPPWYAQRLASSNVYQTPAGGYFAAQSAGYFYLRSAYVSGKNGNQANALLQYGDHGYFHVGKGACVWEAKVYGLADQATYLARMGLKCQASGFTNDIFKSGGLGFEASFLNNNGRFSIIGGTGYNIRKVATNIQPSSGWNKLRIEVDHDGLQADYFINDVYVGSILGGLPTNDPSTLLAPCFETQAYRPSTGAVIPTYYWIDYIYLRKFLLR
jgi:hypothetical protein